MSRSLEKLISGRNAQLYALFSTILIQLLQVPIFIWTVGIDGFGRYTVLFAIPAFLAVLDLGVFGASSTNLIISRLKGDLEAVRLRISKMTSIYFYLVGMGSFAMFSLVFTNLINAPGGSLWQESVWISSFLGAFALLQLYATFWESVMRGLGHHVKAWFLLSSFRVVDFITLSASLFVFRSLFYATLAFFLSRAFLTIYLISRKKQKLNEIDFALRIHSLPKVLSELKVNNAAIAQVIGNWLMQQGSVFIIGVGFGHAQAALFSSLRTFVGFIRQLGAALLNAELPDLTQSRQIMNPTQSFYKFKKLRIKVLSLGLVTTLAFIVFGQVIYSLWTASQIQVSWLVISIFSLCAFSELVFLGNATWLISKNEHFRVMIFYALSSAVLCGLFAIISNDPLVAGIVMCAQLGLNAMYASWSTRRSYFKDRSEW